ncbi:MAG TPA: Fe-S-containing hydro-lyase [Syntrophothermus lipocalidus]|uniref:Hydro-lyase, Fe-S type, tartrate/fumarate subfamily, beta subunit n=1 Tax=Syntrophothermus lipocalidus (strain DSM 12680 / TGB-C1) TaxID=643648 RepID=D7CIS0_SYNLT|nr:Fe-S-containing hydro-lyase [Syntrophothermus lipocalidus]ADI02798.1 hydro-lyase, Fe-S type, tartrate/fumarate subfamily, beta subunit [Syntrophothermus lipocalidus DSM 12680]HHV77524.1 Fe-S-containing hydro-lyase [Syntrophothermus lipocalidus]
MLELKAPLSNETVNRLRVGDLVKVSGTVYTARDAAHQLIVKALEKGESLPFSLEGQIVYYTGPCPAPPGRVIGSCGPTTSGRMDAYTPHLLSAGMKAMIGKGDRGGEVVDAMQKYGAVYLATIGGAGAYLAGKVKKAEMVAYPELGPEAVIRLEVEGLPCVVAIDSRGGNLYHIGKQRFNRA